jgi:hypothetical protein
LSLSEFPTSKCNAGDCGDEEEEDDEEEDEGGMAVHGHPTRYSMALFPPKSSSTIIPFPDAADAPPSPPPPPPGNDVDHDLTAL